jgi:hypothetical protein
MAFSVSRFNDSSIIFHDQDTDGFVRMIQMLMNFKYRNFQANGYKSITKQPAIYVSAASKYAQDDLRELLSIQVNYKLL